MISGRDRISAEAEALAFGPRGARLATLCVRVAEAFGHNASSRPRSLRARLFYKSFSTAISVNYICELYL